MSRPFASSNANFGTYERPHWLEALAAVALVVALAVYLPILVYRTTEHGFGDVQVFFRAAWAVWTGYPLYEVTDLHGWSYHYPPIFALMMGPFADPLPGFPRPSWALPFGVSVGVFYAISIAAMLLSAHVWAKAIEDHSGIRLSGSRSGWWTIRVGPLLLLAPYFGASFARGQPTTILILLASLFLKHAADRRPALASPALALAIAIKIFPAALLIIPLLRRDLRMLAMTALWCGVFLFVVPALVLGVEPTIELYRTLWIDRLSGIAEGDLANRVEVEISPWSEDMVAFGSMLARTFAAPLAEMPYRLPAWAQALQLAFDLVVVGLVAACGRGRFWNWSGSQPQRPYAMLVAGALLLAALPAILPVAQPHYWAQAAPLLTILIAEHWRRRGAPVASGALLTWSVLAYLAYIATGFTFWAPLRNHGPTTLIMLIPLAAGLVVLARLHRDTQPAKEAPSSRTGRVPQALSPNGLPGPR